MSALQILHDPYALNVTSLTLVYVFLPFFILVFHIAPKKLKAAVILLFSLYFYSLARLDYLLMLVISVLLDFASATGLSFFRRGFWRGVCLWFCVLKNIFLICYFGVLCEIKLLAVPVGLMVTCVSGIGAVLEAYRRDSRDDARPRPDNLIYFAAYIIFFPRLYVGPLCSYSDFSDSLDGAAFDKADIAKGFGLFIEGLIKYAFFGGGLFALYNSLSLIPDGLASVLSAWSLVLSCALSLYFTLSGLSDAARGVSAMLGIHLPQNFYYPYQSRGVTDFFERFNMTVGDFLKRNVLVPLTSQKSDAFWESLNLILIGMLWGNWFGMRINYTLWGVFIAVFMILEKYAYPKALSRFPTLFVRGYSFIVVMISFAFFSGDTPLEALGRLKHLFGIFFPGVILVNDRVLYVLYSNIALLLVSLFLSTNVLSLITGLFRKSAPRLSAWLLGAVDVALLAAFTAIKLRGGAA